MHRLSGYAAAFAVAACLAPAPFAQAASTARDQLISIYMLEVSRDLCKFELKDAENEALEREADRLETAADIDEDDALAVHRQIETEMKRQQEQGLCEADGAWAN